MMVRVDDDDRHGVTSDNQLPYASVRELRTLFKISLLFS